MGMLQERLHFWIQELQLVAHKACCCFRFPQLLDLVVDSDNLISTEEPPSVCHPYALKSTVMSKSRTW